MIIFLLLLILRAAGGFVGRPFCKHPSNLVVGLPTKNNNNRVRFCAVLGTNHSGSYPQDDNNEEDSLLPKAYRNRSMSWTHRYRSVLPYKTARQWVMELGLRNKEEWDEYVQDGKIFHRSYLPNHPDEMYAEEWVSWDEFLGIMRPYNETRSIVQNVLNILTMEEYVRFINMNPKRAEGLRIPAKPWIVYRDDWIGDEDFFGTWK